MTMQANHIDEWLNKAFSLAYFLHNDREIAKKIAVGAMNKLETASNAQFKRYYYTPTGRADGAKATRNRVSLNDLQLLQRLVFVESEVYEREQERVAQVCERRLLRYFIKHLVRISLKRNSFYVTLAVSRILHNYATADAMEIYNVVVQDPERVHDDYYYRSRKGVLMKELKARFGELLEVVKVNRGEERFNSKTAEEDMTAAAYECLKSFTPWNSSCALPEKFDPFADVIKPFHFDKKDPDEEHRTEVNRIHAALHPDCFGRLTRALNLSTPDDKMEIPKFMMTEIKANTDNNNNGPSSPLDADELEQIKQILAAQAAGRKAANAGFLRVMADGALLGQIETGSANAATFELGGDAELIEIYSTDKTLLATHLLDFDKLRFGRQTETMTLEGGRKITFDLSPVLDEFGEVAEVNFAIRCTETGWRRHFARTLSSARDGAAGLFSLPVLKPTLALGAVLLAAAVGWSVFRNFGGQPNQYVKRTLPSDSGGPANIPNGPGKEITVVPPNEPGTPAEMPRREDQGTPQYAKRETGKTPVSKKPRRYGGPPDEQLATNYNGGGTDENGILRVPIRETAVWRVVPNVKRRVDRKLHGIRLKEANLIYIEYSGDQILGKRIAAEVASGLAGGPYTVTADKELADAALKLHVRHESDVDDPEEKMVVVLARLVNAKGFVIYPDRKGITGWKYVGTVKKLSSRVAGDLIKAKK